MKHKSAIGIGMLKRLSNYLPRYSLVTLYKAFILPHLDHTAIIYDRPNNTNISDNIESLQYNAALAITGAIRGSSKETFFQELDFEYLSSARWLRKLFLIYKTVVNKSPNDVSMMFQQLIDPIKLKAVTKFYI